MKALQRCRAFISGFNAVSRQKVKVYMSFYRFALMFCALTIGCNSAPMEEFIHESAGCQTSEDCDLQYGPNTRIWCTVSTDGGTCHYQTSFDREAPGCVSDQDCDDSDPISLDSCEANGCRHVFSGLEIYFEPISSVLTSNSEVWQKIGTVTLVSAITRRIDYLALNSVVMDLETGTGIVDTAFVGDRIFDSFALAQEGNVRVTAPNTGLNRVEFFTPDFFVELAPGHSASLELWAKVNPSYHAIFPDDGVAARVTLAAISDRNGQTFYGNPFSRPSVSVIHRSKPSLLRQAIATTRISNGPQQDLYRVQITADPNGPVRVYSLNFILNGSTLDGTVGNFSLRRGAVQIPNEDAEIVYWAHESGEWVKTSLASGIEVSPSDTEFWINVIFREPLIITSSGIVLTLSASTSGFVDGDSLSTTIGGVGLDGVCGTDGTIVRGPDTNPIVWRTSAIVWDDFGMNGSCFGTTSIGTLTWVTTLTR